MKTYTTAQVAKITKRSPSVISKLIKEGKLDVAKGNAKISATRGKSKAGRPTYIVTIDAGTPNNGIAEKDHLIGLVHGLVPKGGYRKNIKPSKKPSTPANLTQVLRFMELPNASRELLLTLGEKATDETIGVLLGLV